jgi:hypothetical protein
MKLKSYIWGMRVIVLLSLLGAGAIAYSIDPGSGAIGAAFFYLAIFFALAGFFNLFLLGMRRRLIGEGSAAENVGISFRQGILLSMAVIGILILQGNRLLVWWDALLVVAGVFLIEMYFLSRN